MLLLVRIPCSIVTRRPRVLFVTFPEPGHFNLAARVARRVAARGADVGFFSLQDDVSERLRRAGVDAETGFATQADVRTNKEGHEKRAQAFIERVRKGGAWYARWLRYVLVDLVERQVEEVTAFLERFRPDVVSADPLAYAASIAATRARLPWAATNPLLVAALPESWRCPYVDILATFEEDILGLFARFGLEPPRLRIADVVSPWLNTMFTSEMLTPRSASGNDYAVFVGAPSPDPPRPAPFPWDRIDSTRRLVYVASGTQFSFPPNLYTAVADAASSLGYQAVFAGDAAIEALGDRPDVVATSFAPQLELLSRATLMVGHGGANSFLEALSMGRPLAIFPLGHEQPLQAQLVANAGVGVWLRDEDLEASACKNALRALAEDEAIAKRTQAVAASLRTDGADRAAELLVELAKSGRPIAP